MFVKSQLVKLGVGFVVAMSLLAAGCEPTQRVVRDDWAMWTDAMKAGGANITVGGEAERGDPMTQALNARREAGFAIRLGAYDAAQESGRAAQDAVWARVQGIGNVWSVEADGMISIYAGRYSRIDDPSATKLVHQVRTLERSEDDAPFADAQVVQLAGVDAFMGDDPYDLRTYSGEYEYSVQVGFFDVQYKGDRRAAAEEWVRQLRDEENERAFYYHGPHRSMVTVGLFTRRDMVRKNNPRGGWLDVPGPDIESVREKYPHNLGNGLTLRQKNKAGEDLGEQSSFVVRIP
ncbi:MAG: hypothetical protein AAGJ38_05455 [Planctomycetota bacterium]